MFTIEQKVKAKQIMQCSLKQMLRLACWQMFFLFPPVNNISRVNFTTAQWTNFNLIWFWHSDMSNISSAVLLGPRTCLIFQAITLPGFSHNSGGQWKYNKSQLMTSCEYCAVIRCLEKLYSGRVQHVVSFRQSSADILKCWNAETLKCSNAEMLKS